MPCLLYVVMRTMKGVLGKWFVVQYLLARTKTPQRDSVVVGAVGSVLVSPDVAITGQRNYKQ